MLRLEDADAKATERMPLVSTIEPNIETRLNRSRLVGTIQTSPDALAETKYRAGG